MMRWVSSIWWENAALLICQAVGLVVIAKTIRHLLRYERELERCQYCSRLVRIVEDTKIEEPKKGQGRL